MTNYAPEAVSAVSARSIIDHAYEAAGLPVPNRVDALSALLRAEPTVHDIAVDFAQRSLNGGDADGLLEEVTAAIQRASAIDAFRDIYDRVVDGIALQRIDELRERAASDLAKAFTKLVRDFTAEASKLDADKPFDVPTAFDQDTTSQFKAASNLLRTLAAFTYSAPNHIDGAAPLATRPLAILNIPTIPEPGHHIPDKVLGSRTIQDEHTAARRTVGDLLRDLDRDVDKALVNVAQGRYKGVTFSLGTPAELAARESSATNAISSVSVGDNAPRLI